MQEYHSTSFSTETPELLYGTFYQEKSFANFVSIDENSVDAVTFTALPKMKSGKIFMQYTSAS